MCYTCRLLPLQTITTATVSKTKSLQLPFSNDKTIMIAIIIIDYLFAPAAIFARPLSDVCVSYAIVSSIPTKDRALPSTTKMYDAEGDWADRFSAP